MLIVHIGTQKTGTSALQNYLFQNEEGLLKQGIRYLQTGRPRNHHGVLAKSLRRRDLSVWNQLRRELEESTSHTNLISAEGFWSADPALFKKQLPDAGEVKIVVYLRRQDKYLQSLWKQAVTGGRRQDFNLWRERAPSRGDYFATVERWAEQFGADAIVIRPYERNGIANTIEDFCHVIGAAGLPEQKNLGHNPSPRRELLHFLRAINYLKADVDRHRLFHALIYKNESYVRSYDVLSYDEAAALMDSYADGNRRLTEKYYRESSTPLFPELNKGEPLAVWDVGSEEFFKLTVDVLEVLVQFAATGGLSVDASALVPRADQDADSATVGHSNDRSARALRKAARLIKRRGGQRANGKDPTSPA